MYLLGNFFKKYHTHQRRTVHPLSPLSRTIPHIFHPTTDMAVIGGLLFSIRNVFVLPLIVWGLYQLFQEKTSPKKIFLWGFVFLLSFAITFVPFIWLYPDEFWEVNPFSTQSSLVSFHFIVLFVLIAIAGSFFCRNYNDVRFFSVLLLFGIVTIHFIEAICQYSFTQALFQSKADISYYIFCIPYLLQILADTDYKRLMNPQTWIREKGYCG